MKKILLPLVFLLVSFAFFSCDAKESSTTLLTSKATVTELTTFETSTTHFPTQTTISTQNNKIEGTDMINLEYVHWLGRTYYDETEELKYFYFTASGFEVAFYGTELKVILKATNHDEINKQAHLVILLDKEDPTKGETFILDQEEKEYTLASGLEYGFHEVKVLKRSEASDSVVALKQVTTDGYFTEVIADKSYKIQFIGDSTSVGYGNLGSLGEAKTTANSDGLRAYAYLTGYLLDAEISIFSASGWGVSRGFNTSGRISETENIPSAFDYYAIDNTNKVYREAGLWNHSDFVPDVIVVNLGVNDFNSAGYDIMNSLDRIDLEYRYWLDYTAFLVKLSNLYPDALIIVAFRFTNVQNGLVDTTLEVINEANRLTGATKIYAFEVEPAGTLGNDYGCDYHSNVGTNKNIAQSLAEYINSLTGREIVRTMID
jgi:hypothetical protein